MDIHVKPSTYTRTCACDTVVTVTSTVGPSAICAKCAALLIAVIFGVPGAEFPPEYLFPLAGANPVSCGNRRDLPKAQRRHAWAYLGTDARHMGDGGFEDLHIYACAECGRDRQTRTAPAT